MYKSLFIKNGCPLEISTYLIRSSSDGAYKIHSYTQNYWVVIYCVLRVRWLIVWRGGKVSKAWHPFSALIRTAEIRNAFVSIYDFGLRKYSLSRNTVLQMVSGASIVETFG